jgi:DNA-binding PadR family transcriptional regulator
MNSTRLPKLTTTSFALLGLLQRRPWSAYELTGYMRNSILRAVWPRAESHLYSEPKLLQRRGLVSSHEERTGARKRTVYSITDEGRAALAEWLQQERESEFRFEYELLLRLAFAESLDASWAQKYLQQVRDEALRDARFALAGVEEILHSPAELASSDNSAFTGAIIHMIIDQLEMRVSWAEKMSARLAAAGDPETRGTASLDLYTDAQHRLRELVSGIS